MPLVITVVNKIKMPENKSLFHSDMIYLLYCSHHCIAHFGNPWGRCLSDGVSKIFFSFLNPFPKGDFSLLALSSSLVTNVVMASLLYGKRFTNASSESKQLSFDDINLTFITFSHLTYSLSGKHNFLIILCSF